MKRANRIRSGFSLVEVLISVVILALGVLGLAAVFPAVIRQQRAAQDETMGVVVARSAQMQLERATSVIRWDKLELDSGFSADRARGNDDAFPACGRQAYNGRWEPTWNWPGLDSGDAPRYADQGTIVIRGGLKCVKYISAGREFWGDPTPINSGPPEPEELLLVQERVFPTSYSGSSPQFVWDPVARRLPGSVGRPGPIQVAVFVRRIDPNIRVPAGATLSQLLTPAQTGERPAVLPLGVDRDGNPTLNGTGDYSTPLDLEVTTTDAQQDGLYVELELAGGTNAQRRHVAQVGQKLLDNLGQIREVTGWRRDGDQIVALTVSPGLSSAEQRLINQVVYTPQIPAAVLLFNP